MSLCYKAVDITSRKYVRVSTLLTMLLVGIFLFTAPLSIPVLSQEDDNSTNSQTEDDEQDTLVRSGGEITPTKIIAIGGLFSILVFIGIHAYTTQIYPSN